MHLSTHTIWLLVGFAGQALFGVRFLVQWMYSEYHGRSLIPYAFWYFSIAGGAVLLCYAIYRNEPVFILGETLSLLIFLRNLQWRVRESRRA